LLTNPKFPVQLIIAGKAHPADKQGQNLIKEWMQFIKQNGLHPPVIFLSDYDMNVSENLVQGVDVWINTPRRPWEACGTSGMKVLVNGGINLSELDGWWAKAYTPEVGWALGDGNEHGDDPAWDAREAEQLYNILENEVIPEFYNRNEHGIPTAWVARMRESMAQLTPKFSADRAVREYTEQHYLPAATTYLDRASDNGVNGKQMITQLQTLQENWDWVHFGEVKIATSEKQYVFDVQVYFNDIEPDKVQVELFANGLNGEDPIITKMKRGKKSEGTVNGYHYSVSVNSSRPATDYTPRVIPHLPGLSVPLETTLILWQH
jgi:starch phosphorylase